MMMKTITTPGPILITRIYAYFLEDNRLPEWDAVSFCTDISEERAASDVVMKRWK
jgi:hypothetical protein